MHWVADWASLVCFSCLDTALAFACTSWACMGHAIKIWAKRLMCNSPGKDTLSHLFHCAGKPKMLIATHQNQEAECFLCPNFGFSCMEYPSGICKVRSQVLFFRKAPEQVLESIWTCRPKLAKWSRRVFEASLQTCALCFCSLASTRMAQEWAWVCMRTDDPTQLLKEVLLSKIFWNHLPMVVAPPANQEGVLSVPILTIC